MANRVLQSARRIFVSGGDSWSWVAQDPVLKKIDALLTLTAFSLLADQAVLYLVFLSFNLNHLPIRPPDH
jgi:hypothetical protein